MSELYRINIEKPIENKVQATITIVHPDASPFFYSKDFALQILIESFEEVYCVRKPPAYDREVNQQLPKHPKEKEYLEYLGFSYGEQFSLSKEEYDSLWDNLSDIKAKIRQEKGKEVEIGSFGHSHYKGYYAYYSNPRKIFEIAKHLIIKDPIDLEMGMKRKVNEREFVMEFEVADINLLYHLQERCEYETANFNLEAYYDFK
jgi:hypothetical protein